MARLLDLARQRRAELEAAELSRHSDEQRVWSLMVLAARAKEVDRGATSRPVESA
jgi:hypothetical protein